MNRLLRQLQQAFIAAALLITSACDTGVQVASSEIGFTKACISTHSAIAICPTSDMAKIAKSATIPYEHADYDWSAGPLQLRAARNETIAFQLILRKTSPAQVDKIVLSLGDIYRNTASASTTNIAFSQSVYTAFYHPIDNAGYTWGPPTPVLPWPAEYPDALVPTQSVCEPQSEQLDTQINAPTAEGSNQSVWIDSYIPKGIQPGTYTQKLQLRIDDTVTELPITFTIYDVTLPDKPSINAVGELYRAYAQEGVGGDVTSAEWRQMSQCYQKLAHQHRMVFIERLPNLLTTEQLDSYADVINPALTGELFTANTGYVGPGANTPVAVWKTPWPQQIDANNYDLVAQSEIERYRELASTWHDMVIQKNWNDTDYFAYVFDEVDGPQATGNGTETVEQYIARVHDQMAQVQASIDMGSNTVAIDLIWTSHSNPASWQGDPLLDLTGTIRLWAPNAAAADTEFLQNRMRAGEKAWFYHSGHPAVGAHSINVSGIEMRTWGVIGARYGFQGQFMWALNLGSDDFPFRDPQYRPNEDRAGNGVMVYPGNQLDRIGYDKSPGPVPSMRLKAWRRGLQDAELYYLAYGKSEAQANLLINAQIPNALSEGKNTASWSNESSDWIDFHRELLEVASQP